MTSLLVVTLLATLALAWANGSNDVSKGIATLVGSGRASYRTALRWGTVWTVAGSVASLAVSVGLIQTFSTALVAPEVSSLSQFSVAVAGGALVWVLIATVTGMPVSTTHALTGAIVGTGVMVSGLDGVRWPALLTVVVLPLALSPLAAAGLARVLHATLRRSLERASAMCVCVRHGGVTVVPLAGGSAAAGATLPAVWAGRAEACAPVATHQVTITDGLHWMTSGALSFARGLNDTPKILALGAVALPTLGVPGPLLFIGGAVAMAAGSLWGQRVTHTLAERVTEIDPLEGLASSGTAAGLVLLASFVALPVSTTHVATGAIVGAGLSGGQQAIQWPELFRVALAWFVTLPVSAAVAAGVIWAVA